LPDVIAEAEIERSPRDYIPQRYQDTSDEKFCQHWLWPGASNPVFRREGDDTRLAGLRAGSGAHRVVFM